MVDQIILNVFTLADTSMCPGSHIVCMVVSATFFVTGSGNDVRMAFRWKFDTKLHYLRSVGYDTLFYLRCWRVYRVSALSDEIEFGHFVLTWFAYCDG